MKPTLVAPDYRAFLIEVKDRIQSARLQAGRAVNRELVLLYWGIGRGIVEKQQTLGWGDAVVENFAADLRAEFPDMRGFSPRNLRNMKQFYTAYREPEIWQQAVAKFTDKRGSNEIWQQAVAKLDAPTLRHAVAEIPWGHHLMRLNKLSDPSARLYYLRATAQ